MTTWEFLNQKFQPNERDPLNLSQHALDSMRDAAIAHAMNVIAAGKEAVSAPSKEIPEEPEGWITAKQAAKYVGVHYQTFLNWCNDTETNIPKIPLPGKGHDFRFKREMLDEWGRNRADERTGSTPVTSRS
jgi:excisionase family DNA binding protein